MCGNARHRDMHGCLGLGHTFGSELPTASPNRKSRSNSGIVSGLRTEGIAFQSLFGGTRILGMFPDQRAGVCMRI